LLPEFSPDSWEVPAVQVHNHFSDGWRPEAIQVSGSIQEDTYWDADSILVTGSVTVEDGVLLTAAPGVEIVFLGFYRFNVQGAVQAIGTADEQIRFTSMHSDLFTADSSFSGCWNGIRFDHTPGTNPVSRFEYCRFEYSKALSDDPLNMDYGGGVFYAANVHNLEIENCIFSDNLAHFGGAVFLTHNATPRIINNLFSGNYALENASVLYCAYSYPEVTNNTMIDNIILNELNPYIESCAILSFIAKPRLTNNIIRNNDPILDYMHAQLWQVKAYYTRHNNIEGYPDTLDNYDFDPLFLGGGYHPWSLAPESPAINQGSADQPWITIPENDLAGLTRQVETSIDLGAYEFSGNEQLGDVNCDESLDILDIVALVNMVLYDQIPPCYALMDLNADNQVNVLDVIAVINSILDN